MKSIKILHIGQLVGGLDVYIRNTVMNSDERFEYVIVHGESDKSEPVMKNGKPVKEYKISLHRSLNPFNDVKALFQAVRIIRCEKPDVTHCHSAKGGFVGRVAGWLTCVRTFYTPHAFSFLSTPNRLKRSIYLLLERMAVLNSRLLACSESERSMGIMDVGYKPENALVWANAIPDIDDAKLPADADFPYICYIGRPSYQKNTFFFVDVINEVHKQCPDIKFLLLGVGYYSPDLDELKEKIAAYNLQNVVLLKHWLSHDETMGYVKSAMFYVSVARYEGLPLSIIEAMSLGKAIVASDVIGNKDCVRNGYNGWLLPLDKHVFAENVTKLINDERQRQTFGRNSLALFASNFSIKKQIGLLNSIYKQA